MFDDDATTAPRPATDAMLRFIGILKAERSLLSLPMTVSALIARDPSTLTFTEARTLINALGMQPRAGDAEIEARILIDALKGQPQVKAVELEAGMYLMKGAIFKVQRAVHRSNRMYAKQLTTLAHPYPKIVRGKEVMVKAEFRMAPGAVRLLTPDMRMTIEQAKEYGALYGVCVRCGATLTDETSIEQSMGPVCGNRKNWRA